MKIQIASDLHLDLLEDRFPGYRILEPADADVLVIAGDIHRATRAIAIFADWPVPVIYVHGNHELYHEQADEAIESLRAASAGSNVHFLERDACVLNGVRFLGCCLWTDYRLYPDNVAAAMQKCEQTLLDHRVIHTRQGLFTPQEALRLHRRARDWLEAQLREDVIGPTVVVTHHAPHPKSIHPRYAGSLINAGFASDLTPLVEQADVWIHGHMHDSFDYAVAGARVVANPRGYARNRLAAPSPEALEWENRAFDPKLVVEIA